jgi:hypothetical protein
VCENRDSASHLQNVHCSKCGIKKAPLSDAKRDFEIIENANAFHNVFRASAYKPIINFFPI